jgi:hypothetical protein
MSSQNNCSTTSHGGKALINEGNTSTLNPETTHLAGGNVDTPESPRPFLHEKLAQNPVVSGGPDVIGIMSGEEPGLDEGWPLLARLMEKNPEFEGFTRFRELNVKNLLYYQVELDYVSNLLRREELRDRKLAHMDSEREFSKCPIKMIKKYEEEGRCK